MIFQHFNPHDMADDLIKQVATGREGVLDEVLGTVAANLRAATPQHILVAAPRGFGKSFLARLVAVHLAEQRAAGQPIGMALLPEEQPNVTAPHLLIEEIRRVFEGKGADSVVPGWFDEDADEAAWEDAVQRLDAALDAAFGAGRGLLVAVVENIDQLVNHVFRDGEAQSRLRKLMSEYRRLMLIVTSATAALDKGHEGRLFHAFRQLDLEPWTEQECVDYFNRQLGAVGHEKLNVTGEAKARTLALFIGGTPRLATLLAEILINKDSLRAAETLDALMDRLTPYYKHRIENLAWRPRKLLDALLRLGEPCSQSELAERVGASQSAIAQAFKDLLRERLVVGQRASGGRETLYRAADRVLAHYYRKRFLTHGQSLSPLEAIAEFLEAFFTADEKRAEAERLRQMGRQAEAAVMERLAGLGPESGGGAGRSYVFGIAHRLRIIADALAPAAKDRLAPAIEDFAAHRPRAALAAFGRIVSAEMPDAERIVWLLLAGSASTQCSNCSNNMGSSNMAAAFERLDEAVELAERVGTAEAQFSALDIRSHWQWFLGNWQEAIADLRAEVHFASAINLNALRNLAMLEDIFLKGEDGDYLSAAEKARRLSKVALHQGDTYSGCRALRYLAWNLGMLSRHEEAIAAVQEAIELAVQRGDDRERAMSTSCLAWNLGELGRREEAIAATREAIELAAQCGDDRERAKSTRHLAWNLGELGRHEEAIAAAREAIELAARIGDDRERAESTEYLAWNLGKLGRYEETIAAARELVPIAEKQVSHLWRIAAGIAGRIADIANEEGRAAAFAAAAQFIDAISSAVAGDGKEASTPGTSTLADLFRQVAGELARRLRDAALLRDIAERIREHLPDETQTLQQLLEAAARYAESGNDRSSLERVDPDIALAILRTRGEVATASGTGEPKGKEKRGEAKKGRATASRRSGQ